MLHNINLKLAKGLIGAWILRIGGVNLTALKVIFTILQILVCVAMIVIVLLQSGKQAGLSGSIAGGAETFFGKNKGRTLDAKLSKFTTVAAIVFLITSVVLQVLMNK